MSRDLLSNEIFPLSGYENLFWEEKVVRPFDNLFVSVAWIVRAERRITDEAFEKDGPQ